MSVALRDAVFAVIDVETTGLQLFEHPLSRGEPLAVCGPGGAPVEVSSLSVNRVVEVGATVFRGDGELLGEVESLVDPGRPIPVEAVRVHGITDQDVAGAPSAPEVLAEVMDLVESADALFGYNSPFDLRFIVHEWRLAGIEPIHVEAYDVARLAGRLGYGRCRLATLYQELTSRMPGHAHRALGDARLTGTCLSRLLQRHFRQDSPLDDLLQLHDQLTPVYTTRKATKTVDRARGKWLKATTRRVCITGKLPGMTRGEIEARLAALGFRYSKEVTRQVEFLVVGDSRPARRKIDDATRLSVPVLAASEFVAWLAERERALLPPVSRRRSPPRHPSSR